MQRREFIAGLGGSALWPRRGRTQQRAHPVIGFLANATPDGYKRYVAGFRQGLEQSGLFVGQNVDIEYRWGDFQDAKLIELASDLVGRRVAVLLVGSGDASAYAARSTTSSIPIVLAMGGDPVTSGLVSSLNRPGGNITGVTYITVELMSKRLDLLRRLTPNAKTIGYLTRPPNSPTPEAMLRDMLQAANTLGLAVVIAEVRRVEDFEATFDALAQQNVDALVVAPNPLITSTGSQLVKPAARHRIPTIWSHRDFATDGGLVSYGANIADAYRRAGQYVARILKGEKPSDLPIERSTTVEFVVNLKTAKALDLTIPETLLATADEVIE